MDGRRSHRAPSSSTSSRCRSSSIRWPACVPGGANARTRATRSSTANWPRSNGRPTSSRRPAMARCRWATHGTRMGVRRRRCRIHARRRWSSTRPSTPTPPATSRSRPARRWPTGGTARSTCTARRRAWPRRWRAWRAGPASTPANVVIISEYTGGGFGSKIPGAHTMAIPALLAKKAGAPVMMRISREEEHYIGRTRPNLLGRVEGRPARGRPHHRARPVRRAGRRSLRGSVRPRSPRPASARSPTSRWRCASAACRCSPTTPPRTSQRSPGGMQQNAILEPVLAKAARQLGHRCGGAAPDQRAVGQGAARAARQRGPPQLRHQRVRARGARQGRRAVQLGRAQGAQPRSAAARRCAASACR